VSAPLLFSQTAMGKLAAAFALKYPEVRLEITTEDRTVDMIVSVGRLLMGGVCERFPKLRFLFLESGGGWMATQLQRMDEQVKAFPLERRWLSLLPSEYFRRQCYVSFEPGEWNLAASAEFLGSDRILWASDYPHPDIEFPGAVRELRESLASLPRADQQRIAGGNAIAAYRLPL